MKFIYNSELSKSLRQRLQKQLKFIAYGLTAGLSINAQTSFISELSKPKVLFMDNSTFIYKNFDSRLLLNRFSILAIKPRSVITLLKSLIFLLMLFLTFFVLVVVLGWFFFLFELLTYTRLETNYVFFQEIIYGLPPIFINWICTLLNFYTEIYGFLTSSRIQEIIWVPIQMFLHPILVNVFGLEYHKDYISSFYEMIFTLYFMFCLKIAEHFNWWLLLFFLLLICYVLQFLVVLLSVKFTLVAADNWRLLLNLSQPLDWDIFFMTAEHSTQFVPLNAHDSKLKLAVLRQYVHFYSIGFIDNELKYFNSLNVLLQSSKSTFLGYRGFLNLFPGANVLLDSSRPFKQRFLQTIAWYQPDVSRWGSKRRRSALRRVRILKNKANENYFEKTLLHSDSYSYISKKFINHNALMTLPLNSVGAIVTWISNRMSLSSQHKPPKWLVNKAKTWSALSAVANPGIDAEEEDLEEFEKTDIDRETDDISPWTSESTRVYSKFDGEVGILNWYKMELDLLTTAPIFKEVFRRKRLFNFKLGSKNILADGTFLGLETNYHGLFEYTDLGSEGAFFRPFEEKILEPRVAEYGDVPMLEDVALDIEEELLLDDQEDGYVDAEYSEEEDDEAIGQDDTDSEEARVYDSVDFEDAFLDHTFDDDWQLELPEFEEEDEEFSIPRLIDAENFLEEPMLPSRTYDELIKLEEFEGFDEEEEEEIFGDEDDRQEYFSRLLDFNWGFKGYENRSSALEYTGNDRAVEYGDAETYREGVFDTIYDDLADFFWLNSFERGVSSWFVFSRGRFINDLNHSGEQEQPWQYRLRYKRLFYALPNFLIRTFFLKSNPVFFLWIYILGALAAFNVICATFFETHLWLSLAFTPINLFLLILLNFIATVVGGFLVLCFSTGSFRTYIVERLCKKLLIGFGGTFFYSTIFTLVNYSLNQIFVTKDFKNLRNPLKYSRFDAVSNGICLYDTRFFFSLDQLSYTILLDRKASLKSLIFFNVSQKKLIDSSFIKIGVLYSSSSNYQSFLSSYASACYALAGSTLPAYQDHFVNSSRISSTLLLFYNTHNLDFPVSQWLLGKNFLLEPAWLNYRYSGLNFEAVSINLRNKLGLKNKNNTSLNVFSRFYFAGIKTPVELTTNSIKLNLKLNLSENVGRGQAFPSTNYRVNQKQLIVKNLERKPEEFQHNIAFPKLARFFFSYDLLDRTYAEQAKIGDMQLSEPVFYSTFFGVTSKANSPTFFQLSSHDKFF